MRTYAIIQQNIDRDVIGNIAEQIRKYDSEGKIYLFTTDKTDKVTPEIIEEIIKINIEIYDVESKIHNFVVRWFKENCQEGFLHVFKDNVGVVPENMEKFAPEIEQFMKIFGYDVWLNTFTDGCNFIFDKWIPRVNVVNDNEELKKKYDKTIMWTSNANTNFMIYDLDVLKLENVLFDESFSIGMFYIIKFFAERRNRKLPGCFMNFYPTLESEKGTLKDMKYPSKEDKDIAERMRNEDKIFKEMNIDYRPTEQLEPVLEFIRTKLTEL